MKRSLLLMQRLLAVLLTLATCAWAQVPVAIRVSTANARKAPNANAEMVTKLKKGQIFLAVKDLPRWYGIQLKSGSLAYVAKRLCTVVPEEGSEDEHTAPPDDFAFTPPVQPGTTAWAGCTPTTISADWSICPAAGSGGVHSAAYVQKNRLQAPCSYTPMTVADMLALTHLPANVRALPASDNRFQYLEATESQSVVVEGYIALVKSGGKEGVNCGSSSRVDVHMEVVGNATEDPADNRDEHVIAEVTPWFGAAMPGWTKTLLGQYASYTNSYSGSMHHPPTPIRVYGWLFFDEAHAGDGSRNWRGTEWEVHPITKIEILENGNWTPVQ